MSSRVFKIQDPSWGEHDILVIHENEDGTWDEEWRAFQEHPEVSKVGALFSRVTQEAYQDALHKYTTPLIQELGLPPEACLIKTPPQMKLCAHRKTCAMHEKGLCLGDNPKAPMCYQAALEGLDTAVEIQVARVFELWRMGFYIIVVPPEDTTI